MTGPGNAPHGLVPGGRIVIVQALGFQKFLDLLRGNAGIVPGHFVEQMVYHVRGTDGVVKEIEDAVVSINGRERALDPGPLAFTVVRDGRVRMLQPRVEYKPSIDKGVRSPVPQQNGKVSDLCTDIQESSEHGEFRRAGKGNLGTDLGGEHGRAGSKVIRNRVPFFQPPTFVRKLSGTGQTGQVERPADEQVRPDLKDGKGAVSHGLVPRGVEGVSLVVRPEAVILGGRRDVRLAVHQMVGTTVVFRVGVLPGKVGDEQSLVDDKADNVIERLGVGVSAVSTFVRNYPRPGENGSHPKGVDAPAESPGQNERGVLGKVGGEDL